MCLWFACYTHTDRYTFISLYFSSESIEAHRAPLPPAKIYVQREKENLYEMRKTGISAFKNIYIYKNRDHYWIKQYKVDTKKCLSNCIFNKKKSSPSIACLQSASYHVFQQNCSWISLHYIPDKVFSLKLIKLNQTILSTLYMPDNVLGIKED